MMEMTRRDTTAWTGAAALVKRVTGRHRYERLRPQLARIAAWRHRNDLSALERVFGSDKVGVHFYAPHYHHHFDPVRHRRLNVLEIGIGGYDDPNAGGGSLRMWKAYFRKARIFGIDIADKSPHREHRIHTFQGSQDDREFLDYVAQQIGRIDIIIDDGSHINRHVVASFQSLFPRLAEGGIYVIEDLLTAYVPGYGGSEDPQDTTTSIGMLKGMIDGLNWEEFADRQPGAFDSQIRSLHFYHNLAFIYKGRNADGRGRRVREPGCPAGQ